MEAPPPKRKTTLRRLAKWLVALALLGGLLWAGWYVCVQGFTHKWRAQLAAELRRRGLDFTAKHLTLNPFEGLVAEDAHLYLLDENHTQLVAFKRVAVDIDIVALILKKPFLNSLDLRGARLKLPIDIADPGQPQRTKPRRLKLRRVQAKIAFLPDEVRLTQAQGDFYGLQISASGSLLHPGSFNAAGHPSNPEEAARRGQWVRAIIDEVEKISSERSPPRIEIRFQGDLAQPDSLRASAQIQGEALRRGGYRLERLLMRLDYSAGAFHLQQAELADAHGTLAAQGDFNPAGGDAHFQLQSSLDLPAVVREFGDPRWLADLTLRDTPHLQLDGHARFGPGAVANNGGSDPASPPPASPASRPAAPTQVPVRAASNDAAARPPPALQFTGRVALGRFVYRTFEFERAETDFSWSGDRWYLRGLRVVRPGGNGQQAITADVLSEPGQARLRLTSTFDPVPFLGMLPAKGQAALARLEFHDLPRVELTATGPSFADPDGLRVEGQFALGRTRYRGAGFNRMKGEFTFANGLVTGRHLDLERDEGHVTGDQVVYEFAKHELRMDNVHVGIDPAQTGVWLDPDVYHTIQPFHFRKPPAIVMNGRLQFDGGRDSHLVTNVSAPGGMDFVFLKKNLPFQSIAGQVVFTEDRMWLNDVHGEIFGGQAQGKLDLALGRAGGHGYAAALEVKNLDFARLTKLYFDYDDSKGLLSGEYHFTGKGDDSRTLHGAGALSVDRGNVFAIPFLGPLSSILGVVMPGLGFDQAHQASAHFLTDGGKIYTGDMDVKGTGFSLFGGGWLGYTNDTMNFRVRMNSRGLPGAVLYPVSKLFEYGSQGPLSKPVWRPRVLGLPATTPPPEASKPR